MGNVVYFRFIDCALFFFVKEFDSEMLQRLYLL